MDNLHSIQDDKVGLVLHNRVLPSLGHLGNTVDTSGEDGQESDEQRHGKKPESKILDDDIRRRAHLSSSSVEAGKVVSDQDCEYKQRKHLPHDTCHHQIIPQFLVSRCFRSRGDASTGALEDQRQEIAADEDPGVPFGGDAREVGPEGEDHVLEGEVDAGGEEGRGDDEAADLDVEAVTVPRIIVQHYTANIT